MVQLDLVRVVVMSYWMTLHVLEQKQICLNVDTMIPQIAIIQKMLVYHVPVSKLCVTHCIHANANCTVSHCMHTYMHKNMYTFKDVNLMHYVVDF